MLLTQLFEHADDRKTYWSEIRDHLPDNFASHDFGINNKWPLTKTELLSLEKQLFQNPEALAFWAKFGWTSFQTINNFHFDKHKNQFSFYDVPSVFHVNGTTSPDRDMLILDINGNIVDIVRAYSHLKEILPSVIQQCRDFVKGAANNIHLLQGNYYIRFGKWPENERSRNWLAKDTEVYEKGVSVYHVDYDLVNDRWAIDPSVNEDAIVGTMQSLVYSNTPVYLVKGDEIRSTGADGEPLLRNVKMVKRLIKKDFYVPNLFEPLEESVLLEYNSTQTLTNYRKPLERRLQGDPRAKSVLGTEPTPEAALRHLESIDPSKKKAFVLNLIKWYIDGSMRFIEDAYKAKEIFPLYTKFKNRDDVPHISKLSFNEFLELGDRLQDVKSGAELNKEEELAFYESGQAELFKDTDEVKIVIPKTKDAAIYFGRNTKWCTSAVNDNMFDRYKGPFYIFLFKKENKRWQFEFNSKQFMDEKDQPLPIEDIYNGFKLLGMSEKEIIKNNAELIQFIENPSEKSCISAVKKRGNLIQHIKSPSEKLQKIVVINDSCDISYIDKPTSEVQKIAVSREGRSLRYIESPSEEVQRLAVQQNGHAIEYIKNPSEEVHKLAVQQNSWAMAYIKNPSEELKRLAVQKNGHAIEFIENPSEEMQIIAVQQNGYSIRFIDNPPEELQKLAVHQNCLAIKYINNPSEDVQRLAVEQNSHVIEFVKNPSEKLQKLAVEQNCLVIKYIKNPSEEVQKLAVVQNSDAIGFIDNPSAEVKRIAADNK